MLKIVFCDQRLTQTQLKQKMSEQGIKFLGNICEYPENQMTRCQYDMYARRIAHLVRVGVVHTILTDSDALLLNFRIMVKHGMLHHYEVTIHVFDRESYSLIALDKKADAEDWPGYLKFEDDLLTRLGP